MKNFYQWVVGCLLVSSFAQAYVPPVRALRDIETRSNKDASLLLTLSSSTQVSRFEQEIATLEKEVFGMTSPRTVTVDPSLVGGFVLKKGDVRVDASYKSHLLSFFNILTGIQSK